MANYQVPGYKVSVIIWCLSSMAITLSNGMTSSEKEELRLAVFIYLRQTEILVIENDVN